MNEVLCSCHVKVVRVDDGFTSWVQRLGLGDKSTLVKVQERSASPPNETTYICNHPTERHMCFLIWRQILLFETVTNHCWKLFFVQKTLWLCLHLALTCIVNNVYGQGFDRLKRKHSLLSVRTRLLSLLSFEAEAVIWKCLCSSPLVAVLILTLVSCEQGGSSCREVRLDGWTSKTSKFNAGDNDNFYHFMSKS